MHNQTFNWRQKSAFVVEFAGYPGAGKTTVAQSLSKEMGLNSRGSMCVTSRPKVTGKAAKVAAMLLYMLIFCRAAWCVMRFLSTLNRQLLTKIVIFSDMCELGWKVRCKRGLFVCDELIVHKVFSLVVGEPSVDEKRLRNMFKEMYKGVVHRLVFFELPQRLACECFIGRDFS